MEYLQNLPSGYSDSLLDSGVSWDAQDIYWDALYMDWSAQQGESSFQYPSFWPEPSWARAARLEEERAARLAKYRARLAEFRERRLYANVVAQLERLRPVEFPEPTRNRAPRKPVPNPVSPKSPAVRSTSHRRRTTQEDITPRIVPKRNVHYCFSSWLSRARPQVDEEPDQEEEVIGTSFPRTPTTSVASLNLEPDVRNSHLHDMELCELLHSLEARNMPEIAKEPFRKAVRARLRKLGLKYDDESIRKYRMSFHDHDPQVHLRPNFVPELSERSELPDWTRELIQGMLAMQKRLDHTVPKVKRVKPTQTGSIYAGKHQAPTLELGDDYSQTRTNNIGTVSADLFYQPDTGIGDSTTIRGSAREDSIRDEEEHEEKEGDEPRYYRWNDSPDPPFFQEAYRLRMKVGPGEVIGTHHSWEVVREDRGSDSGSDFGVPEIPDTTARQYSPSPPPVSQWTPPWQLIRQQLLTWVGIWPMSKLDAALESTVTSHQVDEISLSIWAMQSYKRYVRSQIKDSPREMVDRLFVPPNVADAISTAVFNGRHRDACMMLRDLWAPFGLDDFPRLLIVLTKHRVDGNHWVVHRFSLPDGQLTTYDTFLDRSLPDSIPPGWWVAIIIAWPAINRFRLDDLIQKVIRLYRPLQLGVDNSVAAAGIWKNLLMGFRAERIVDLKRLRESIKTEVKDLIKLKGKLPEPNWGSTD